MLFFLVNIFLYYFSTLFFHSAVISLAKALVTFHDEKNIVKPYIIFIKCGTLLRKTIEEYLEIFFLNIVRYLYNIPTVISEEKNKISSKVINIIDEQKNKENKNQ